MQCRLWCACDMLRHCSQRLLQAAPLLLFDSFGALKHQAALADASQHLQEMRWEGAVPCSALSVRGDRRCRDSSFSVCLGWRRQRGLLSGLLTPWYPALLAQSPFVTGHPDG